MANSADADTMTVIRHLNRAIERAELDLRIANRDDIDYPSDDVTAAGIVAGVVLSALYSERREWLSRRDAERLAADAALGEE